MIPTTLLMAFLYREGGGSNLCLLQKEGDFIIIKAGSTLKDKLELIMLQKALFQNPKSGRKENNHLTNGELLS